jgi:hypothetical protein
MAVSPASPSGAGKLRPRPQPVYARSDLRTLRSLLRAWLAALTLPQRRWRSWVEARAARDRGVEARRPSVDALLRSAFAPGTCPLPADQFIRQQVALFREVEISFMRHYTPWRWSPDAEVRGLERLRAATANGRGAVLWIADFQFQSPVGYAALARSGIRISHLSAPRHGFSSTRFGGRFINPLITGVEARYLAERILMSEWDVPTEVRVVAAMRRLRKRVLAGGIVSVSALCNDWGPVVVPLLAGTTRLAYGAPGLARDAGVSVLPVFVTREENGRVAVTIEPPLDLSKGATTREAAIQATHQFAGILDRYVRRHPAQWRGWNYYVADSASSSSRAA